MPSTAAAPRGTQAIFSFLDAKVTGSHIACASTTCSETVAPVFNHNNVVMAVLDVGSDNLATFCAEDQRHLEALCERLQQQFGGI